MIAIPWRVVQKKDFENQGIKKLYIRPHKRYSVPKSDKMNQFGTFR
jgi:hypothetical protein